MDTCRFAGVAGAQGGCAGSCACVSLMPGVQKENRGLECAIKRTLVPVGGTEVLVPCQTRDVTLASL